MVFFPKVIAFAVTSLVYVGVNAKPCPPVTPSSSATSGPTVSETLTPTSTPSPTNVLENPSLEIPREVPGGTVWDGAPWTFGPSDDPNVPSVQVREQDGTIPAHSGDYYVFANIPIRYQPTSFSQALSGLDTAHQYTLTYYWGITTKQEIHDGSCYAQVSLGDQIVDTARIHRNTAYEYHQYNIVFTPPYSTALLTFTLSCDGGYFYGTELLFDDITLTPSTPACTAVNPPPSGATCGALGNAQNAYSSLIANRGDSSSAANCALSCTQTPLCQLFAYQGGDNGAFRGCNLYSADIATIMFVPLTYGLAYYDIGCFHCPA